ncbi:FAD-dependent monooxygenase phomE' [Exophiala dermatitidis]
MGLQVGIVGAGVAGLSAAIALRRIGHDVEVFERSQFKNENGAAVSLTPNGGRILEDWGFDAVKAGGIENKQARRPKGDTLEPMAPTIDFGNVEQLYGNKWHFYHRVDMHRHLREMAVAAGATIRLGKQVMDVDPESGMIDLRDGSQVQKDLVVVADGQHDRINAKITGKQVPMQRSGQTAYRCLIPMKDILADEETRPLFENQPPGFWAPALPAKGVMVVSYPCRNNEVLNVVAVHRRLGQHATSDDDVFIDDWNFPATHDDLEKVLDGFHPSVKKLLLKSPEVKVYTQMKREPLSKMTKGKAVLIGDACHPMLLTHAQGVSSSIEDAAALEVFLADVPGSDSVESAPSEKLLYRLEQFEQFRLPRVCATQIMTDPVVPGPQAAANYAKQEAEIRKHYSGPLPPTGSMPHSPPICQFFFGYDVRKEATTFLLNESNYPTERAPPIVNGSAELLPGVSQPTTTVTATTEQRTNEIPASEVPKPGQRLLSEPLPPIEEQVEVEVEADQTKIVADAAVPPTQVPVEQGITELSTPTQDKVNTLEQRLHDLERKLAEMEAKIAKFSVHVSTVEVQPTPPQTPPAAHDTPPVLISI